MNNENEIPVMTHPLSSGWRQPKRGEIEIDGKHALMSQRSFNGLYEYSRSIPSGVYPGKMWRYEAGNGKKYLRWFGKVNRENRCPIYQREIILS